MLSRRPSDVRTREPLAGAALAPPLQLPGADGYFEAALPGLADSLPLSFSLIGYNSLYHAVRADTPVLNIDLMPAVEGNAIQEIVIQAPNPLRERLAVAQTSVTTLTATDARALPSLLGEADLIKILQLKPGIIPGPEGTTGLFVRGGNSDQNLVLLDDAVVYNPSHLFGFFSTFNADAVSGVRMYKGGFPARYGGRLSAVLDVDTRSGDTEDFGVSGGLGLVSSRLTFEGPLSKGKHSFLISGRRTYADAITRTVNHLNRNVEGYNPIPNYHFYDLNGKMLFTLSPKDRLIVGGYYGQDVFRLVNQDFDIDFSWGNAVSTARWRHLYNDSWSSDVCLVFSRYQYRLTNVLDGFYFRAGSDVQDIGVKTAFLYAPNHARSLRLGFDALQRRFDVARLRAGSDDGRIRFGSGQGLQGMEYALHATDERRLGERWHLSAGMRASAWFQGRQGYYGLEPRLAAGYTLTPNWSLKASYARMYQYAHLLAGSGLSLPTDVWYPSTPGLRPQISDQLTVSTQLLLRNRYLLTWEAWYKQLHNQIDLIDGAELFGTNDLESQLAIGSGYACSPLELEIEKKDGKLRGWIGYTLAWVKRGDFQAINSGRYFSPRFDARHNATATAVYEPGSRWQLSATMVFTSGYTAWLPQGRFAFFDMPGVVSQPVTPIYGDRNTFRYPAYYRLDLGAARRFKTRRGKEHKLTFSVYNATGRRNPYFIYLKPEYETIQVGEQQVNVPKSIAAKQVSLFPALPSLTWDFAF